MIRKFIYTTLIGISLLWGVLKYFESVLGTPIELTPYLGYFPGAAEILEGVALPSFYIEMAGWVCLGLTAIIYLVGAVNIYRHVRRDPWRAILFTIAAIVILIGLVLFQMQHRGLIDRSSLYLLGIMMVPFVPAVLMLPFVTTFKDYLSAAK